MFTPWNVKPIQLGRSLFNRGDWLFNFFPVTLRARATEGSPVKAGQAGRENERIFTYLPAFCPLLSVLCEI